MECCDWSIGQCLQTSIWSIIYSEYLWSYMAFESLFLLWKCVLCKQKFWNFYFERELRNKFLMWKGPQSRTKKHATFELRRFKGLTFLSLNQPSEQNRRKVKFELRRWTKVDRPFWVWRGTSSCGWAACWNVPVPAAGRLTSEWCCCQTSCASCRCRTRSAAWWGCLERRCRCSPRDLFQ